MKKHTPWGVTQGAVILAPGIISYETASHGGIWLSKSRQAEMGNRSDNWLKNPEWWEEDVDWAIPYVFFAKAIKEHGHAYKFENNLKQAQMTLKWKGERRN